MRTQPAQTDARPCGGAAPWRLALAGALLCFAAVLASGVPVRAQAVRGDTLAFTVRDVPVDRTEVTAAAAREAALLDGQRLAFRRLLERLVPQADYGQLPKLSDAQISDLVQNYEVQSERTSAVRYIATLTYRFKPDDVRTLLRTANIPFAETYAKPYLVLPVLREQGVALLWDSPNPWRDAWGRLPPFDGLAPLVLPKGDLADISDINADQAHSGDDQRLTAIARRYGVAGVYVADAELDTPVSGPATLQVSLIGYGGAGGEQTFVDTYTAATGEDTDAFLQRAALAVTQEIEERWKSGQLLQFGHETTLPVLVNYDDIGQWVALRRRLADLAIIRRTDVVSLTRRQAVINLVYIGDDNQLRLALAQRDLALVAVSPPATPGAAPDAASAPPAPGAAPVWQLTVTGGDQAGPGTTAQRPQTQAPQEPPSQPQLSAPSQTQPQP